MTRLYRVVAWCSDGTAALGAFCVLALILHVTLDVMLRLFFDMPFSATILFASAYYMVVIAFLPQGRVERDEAQISVEVVTALLPRKLVGVFYGLSLALTALVALALTLRTWQEAMTKYRIGAFTIEAGDKILTWPSYFIRPLGFGVLLLVTLSKIVKYLSDARNGLETTLPARSPLSVAEGDNV